jgi:branched-chain amino acid transport system substrate-binding protein
VAGKLACTVVLICSLALAGCLGGAGEPESTLVEGERATVVMSLPRHGVSAEAAQGVEAGARLALADAHGRAGELEIRLVTRSATRPGDLLWDPGRVSANAERAAKDPGAIAYLGELDYGASAVSLPITNEARILQVSPADGLTSLTRTPPGRPRANPIRLRPSERRSFVRLTPSDLLQAETLLALLREDGAGRIAIVFDQRVYGRELAAMLVARARRDGPTPVLDEEYRGDPEQIPGLANGLAEASPDAIVFAGVADAATAPMLAAIDSRLPGVPVYATGGMLARELDPPIRRAPARVIALTPILPQSELGRGGRRLLERLRAAGAASRPEALYGYEAMRLVLAAIARGGRDRERVIAAALRYRERDSVLGALGIGPTGDVEEPRFALHTLAGGRFEFERTLP